MRSVLAPHELISVPNMTLKCNQCSQAFNLMITFQCDHILCLHCFQTISSPILPVKCLKCQKLTQHLQYKLQTVLKCDHCELAKDVAEFWWCSDCHDTACSMCAMSLHKCCETSRWENMHAWKFFVEASEDKLVHMQDTYKKGIDQYFDNIKTKLHREIDKYVEQQLQTLEKDDETVTNTLKITCNQEKLNSATSSSEVEQQRQRVKQHLVKVLDGFRFEGRKVNLNIKAIKFVDGDIRQWNFQEISIDK